MAVFLLVVAATMVYCLPTEAVVPSDGGAAAAAGEDQDTSAFHLGLYGPHLGMYGYGYPFGMGYPGFYNPLLHPMVPPLLFK